MRIAPRNVALAAALVGLVALELVHVGSGPETRASGPLLPALDPRSAARIVLAAGDARVVIERATDGWALPDAFGHPARTERVEGLLDRLAGLSNRDLLSVAPDARADYGVGEGATSVEVFDASGTSLGGVLQGAPAPGSAARPPGSFVRPLGAAEVYRAPRLPPIPVQAAVWLDARLVAFEPTLVRSLRARGPALGPGAGELALERQDVDRWSDASGPVATRAVNALLERLRALFFDEVVAAGTAPELEAPDLALVLTLAGGRADELRFAPVESGVLATRVERDAADAGSAEATGVWVVRLAPDAYALVRDALRGIAERPR